MQRRFSPRQALDSLLVSDENVISSGESSESDYDEMLDNQSDGGGSEVPSDDENNNNGGNVILQVPLRNRSTYVWRDSTRVPDVPDFEGPMQGCSEEVSIDDNNKSDPIAYFRLIFNDELLEHVVTETNRYYNQTMSNLHLAGTPLSPESRSMNWKDISKEELERYLGLVMLMGLISRRGPVAEYWSTDVSLRTPFFGEVMARNRFQQISFYLHFNNDRAKPPNCQDRLYKVRPIYDLLTPKWKALYNLGQNLSIDEGMLKWRGRLSFRVYQKDKPTKYGIKSYILADSITKYCYAIDTYCCEKKSIKETVQRLLTPECYGKWHHLYMDNLYNSVELFEILLDKKIHAAGTLRCHRGEPNEIRNPANMSRFDVIAKDNGKVFVYAWKDKRVVKAISTMHTGDGFVEVERRKKKSAEMEKVKKPTVIYDYNKYMGGCDGLDQAIAYYPSTRKSLKWPRKVFLYLMDISIHNSHVLYKNKSPNNKITLREYRISLLKSLCSSAFNKKRSSDDVPPTMCKRVRTLPPPCRLRGGFGVHKLSLLPKTDKTAAPQRLCQVCAKNPSEKKRKTRYFCVACQIPLCVIDCFSLYHTANYQPGTDTPSTSNG